MSQIQKKYLKRMKVADVRYLTYEVSESDCQETWLEAIPVDKNKGYTRVADNEKFLKILLENDVRSMAVLNKAKSNTK